MLYFIMSPDEVNTLEITGENLKDAVENGLKTDMNVIGFFQEYKLEDCYVEEIKEEVC